MGADSRAPRGCEGASTGAFRPGRGHQLSHRGKTIDPDLPVSESVHFGAAARLSRCVELARDSERSRNLIPLATQDRVASACPALAGFIGWPNFEGRLKRSAGL